MKKIILFPIFIVVFMLIIFLAGHFISNNSTNLSSKEARKSLILEENEWVYSVRLIEYNADNEDDTRLCWLFHVKSNNPSDERNVFVDANTGEVVVERKMNWS